MPEQIESSLSILSEFCEETSVDREHVVAHATLSAFAHHWPTRATDEIRALLEKTERIKTLEHSRWATQRRIAIAKLSKEFS